MVLIILLFAFLQAVFVPDYNVRVAEVLSLAPSLTQSTAQYEPAWASTQTLPRNHIYPIFPLPRPTIVSQTEMQGE